ncbi:MAG: NfeD family protein [Planctomycetota bacterium]
MHLWHLWLIAGLLSLVAELMLPGFLVACFAVGCFAALPLALLGATIAWQLMAFSVGTMAGLFALRPLVLKYAHRKGSGEATNVDALPGRTCIVTEAIDPLRNVGRVKLGGEDWKAVTADESEIEADRKVRVVRVDGAKLVVEPVPEGG